jgi:hypothetical protein
MAAAPATHRASQSAAATANTAYLALADLVYLHDEALGGIISVEGFTDNELAIETENRLMDNDFGRQAVFQLMPQQMYTAAKHLRAFDINQPEASDERDRMRKDLVEDVRREKAHNESELENSLGREVRYGKVLQLQHVASGKLVAVSHHASVNNRDARRVHVSDADVGEAAWFRIMPKLRGARRAQHAQHVQHAQHAQHAQHPRHRARSRTRPRCARSAPPRGHETTSGDLPGCARCAEWLPALLWLPVCLRCCGCYAA